VISTSSECCRLVDLYQWAFALFQLLMHLCKQWLIVLKVLAKFMLFLDKSAKKVELLIVPYSNVMSWDVEGVPGDVEPAVAGEKLVGKVMMAEEFYQALELGWVFRADVGSLADEVL